MTVVPIYNLDDANELSSRIHKRLERDRVGYAADGWQEFSGEPPYWLEIPPEIPLNEMIDTINNL